MEEGQNCGCDHSGWEAPTCIERCKPGLECKGEDKIYNKRTCTKIPGDIDNQSTFFDRTYYQVSRYLKIHKLLNVFRRQEVLA